MMNDYSNDNFSNDHYDDNLKDYYDGNFCWFMNLIVSLFSVIFLVVFLVVYRRPCLPSLTTS